MNVSKSSLVLFRPHNRHVIRELNIKINNEIIKVKDYTKYLGVYIDKHLNWKNHIFNVKIKLESGFIPKPKLKIFAPKSILLSVYFAFITPHIEYGLLNWGYSSINSLNPLLKCLNKAETIIKSVDVNNSFKNVIFSFENFHRLTIGKFMWKLHKNALTDAFKAMFKENTHYSILTRYRDRFKLENPKSFHKRNSITD